MLDPIKMTAQEADILLRLLDQIKPGQFMFRCSKCKKMKVNKPFSMEMSYGEETKTVCSSCY